MDSEMKRKASDSRSQASKNTARGKTQSRYFGDPRLVNRIEHYLTVNRHLTNVNLNVMANQLQKQYSEYARKKQIPFRLSVEKAYKFIAKEYKIDPSDQDDNGESAFTKRRKKQSGIQSDSDSSSPESDESKSFSSDFDKYKTYKNANSMNNALSDLYRKTPVTDAALGIDTPPTLPFFIDKTGNSQEIPEGELPNTKQVDPEQPVQETSSGAATPIQPPKKTPVTKAKEEKTNRKIAAKKKLVSKEEKKPLIQKSNVTFADVGGSEKTLQEVCKLLVHMKHAEVYSKLGVTPPRGFLLHGPPGCGKSLLANAIAGELDLPLIKLAATEVVSGVSGESEEKLRDIFTQAINCAPCILFLDEIDSITQKRENASKDMERRIVSQLLTCMDDLNNETQAHVLVIGATNRPDSIDPALRRAGRFDREISLGIPDESARERILKVLCRNLRLSDDFNFRELAHQSPGYVGADLNSLAREAAMTAVNRILDDVQKSTKAETSASEPSLECPDNSTAQEKSSETNANSVMAWLRDKPPLSDEQLANLYITMEDFKEALRYVQPSAKREGFATIPGVTWDDIGALADVRDELQLAILAPVRHREHFARLGLTNPPGILLAGPPGCGKTLLAKAIANESGINFISVKGPELLNMYVGESERAVRQVFQRARNSAPCVIFFDELDALCPKRSQSADSGSGARVVNQLLTEMDGLEERKQVFIMAATNRPDIIDPAVMRPGRLDKILYVGLPTPEDRTEILKTITKNGTKPLLNDVSLEAVGCDERCSGYTGADLAALVREASVVALKAFIRCQDNQGSHGNDDISVTKEHFDVAFGKVRPSVSAKDKLLYEGMRERLSVTN